MTTFQIANDQGRSFTVRVVRRGDGYGVNDQVVHPWSNPLVEFYDATYAGPVFGPRGQFVNRYYVDTLIRSLCGPDVHGLVLEGASANVWRLDAATFRECMARVLSECVAA